MDKDKLMCLSCGPELEPREVREIVRPDGRVCGRLCAACAAPAEGLTFAQWLDELGARHRPH
jgi:hypothetical protein